MTNTVYSLPSSGSAARTRFSQAQTDALQPSDVRRFAFRRHAAAALEACGPVLQRHEACAPADVHLSLVPWRIARCACVPCHDALAMRLGAALNLHFMYAQKHHPASLCCG